MSNRLPALTNLPAVVRDAATAYTEGVTLLDKLDQDLAAVCGLNPQADAEQADQVLMLAALGRGEDPVLVGTPNEAARRARETYGRLAAAAQRAHVGQLEHALGLLLLKHRDAVIAYVDPQIDPAAGAYLEAIEALAAARSGFHDAMNLRLWATSISNRDMVPHLGEIGMGPRLQVGFSDIDAGDLLAALRADANQAIKDRAVEAARAVVVAREAAIEAADSAAAAARKAVEDAQFDLETGKVIGRKRAAV